MDSAAELHRDFDVTDVPSIVRGAVLLGLFEAVLVLLFSLASRLVAGPHETAALAILRLLGLAPGTQLPGIWTRARTIEGIAGAAGIGLGATVVFLLVDVILLQHIGTYTNRWLGIGGSNWWYHPVWWMAGTFLPWLGAWILANQAERNGRTSPPAAFGTAIGFAVIAAIAGILFGFPGAEWTLATFGLAFIPGLALATALSTLGTRRG
jgi:hypothetical protein